MRKRAYFFSRVLPWIGWMGVIFFFSSQSGERVGTWINQLVGPILPTMGGGGGLVKFTVQKTAHFLEYAVLAILGWRALYPLQARRAALLSAVCSLLYAISDEWHQSFVPGRGPSWRDVGIDGLGIVAGLLLVELLLSFRRGNTSTDRSGLY